MAASTSTGLVIPPPILSPGFEFNSAYDASLESIAATNIVDVEWSLLQDIIKYKLAEIMSKYLIHGPPWPLSPEEALEARTRAFASLATFTGPPFTIQRICELILSPTSHYSSLPKYLRALNRVLNVSSERSAYTEDENVEFPPSNVEGGSNYEEDVSRERLQEGTMTPTKRPSPASLSSHASTPLQQPLLSPIPWLINSSPSSSPSSSQSSQISLPSHLPSSSSPPRLSTSATTTPTGGVVDELDPGSGGSELAEERVELNSEGLKRSSSLHDRFVRAGSPKALGEEEVQSIEKVLEG